MPWQTCPRKSAHRWSIAHVRPLVIRLLIDMCRPPKDMELREGHVYDSFERVSFLRRRGSACYLSRFIPESPLCFNAYRRCCILRHPSPSFNIHSCNFIAFDTLFYIFNLVLPPSQHTLDTLPLFSLISRDRFISSQAMNNMFSQNAFLFFLSGYVQDVSGIHSALGGCFLSCRRYTIIKKCSIL